MAFRKLFAVTVVLGAALAVGCGGTTGKSAFEPADDQAPNNGTDQPPLNGDQPTTNPDRAPSNSSDRPPLNPDSPGGGQLQELCDKLCQVVDRCDLDMGDVNASELCGMGFCTIPAGVQVQVPCVDEIVSLFDCALSLPNLCAPEDSPQAEANAAKCLDSFETFSSCVGDNYEPPSEPDPRPGNGDPPAGGTCTPAGGCQNCMSDCLSCYCQIADDPMPDQMACIDACTP